MHILVVDDHPVLSDALAGHLMQVGGRVLQAAIDVTTRERLDQGLEIVRSDRSPNLVFLDLNLDNDNYGTITLERFQANNPHRIPVVVYTGLSASDEGSAESLLRCYNDLGAQSILLKGAKMETILLGLPRILAGERWLPEDVLNLLLNAKAEKQDKFRFSPTQLKAAVCLTRGLTDKRMANELGLSQHYVRQVLSTIYKKIGVNTRLQAALKIGKVLGQ